MLGSHGTFRKQKELLWHKLALRPESGITSPEGCVTRLPGLPAPDPEVLQVWLGALVPYGLPRNFTANAGRCQR